MRLRFFAARSAAQNDIVKTLRFESGISLSILPEVMHTQRSQNPNPDAYVTLAGLPVTIQMQWPFHGSGSGGDFYLLHGAMTLQDGSGLHADVAVQLSQTFKEQLASLERQDSESAVVNALRKELDRKQLELLKSGKKQPVPISSRHYSIKNHKLVFAKADDAQIRDFLQAKVFWLAYKLNAEKRDGKVWVADVYDGDYLGTTAAHLFEIAAALAKEGLLQLDDEFARVTDALISNATAFEKKVQTSLEALHAKHAFERG
jgi:hypothetical protein